jgi:hypothetical protein
MEETGRTTLDETNFGARRKGDLAFVPRLSKLVLTQLGDGVLRTGKTELVGSRKGTSAARRESKVSIDYNMRGTRTDVQALENGKSEVRSEKCTRRSLLKVLQLLVDRTVEVVRVLILLIEAGREERRDLLVELGDSKKVPLFFEVACGCKERVSARKRGEIRSLLTLFEEKQVVRPDCTSTTARLDEGDMRVVAVEHDDEVAGLKKKIGQLDAIKGGRSRLTWTSSPSSTTLVAMIRLTSPLPKVLRTADC